jgi:hypothetical protein
MESVMGTIGQIQLKGQTSIEKEYTFDLPMCWETGSTCKEYIAVLNEKTAIQVFISDDLMIIEHTTPERIAHRIIKAQESWEEIPDGNFLEAYEKALASISLKPALAA